jgi:hypothetical protein
MDFWTAVMWGVLAVAVIPGLYGLHRLCLWLEARGWLYYLNKKPAGGAAKCMIGLQEAIEPPVKHVLHVRDERRRQADGEGDPPAVEPD